MWIDRRFPILWVLPVLAPVALMTVYPVAHALWTSLHQQMLLIPGSDFVGFDNFRNVLSSRYFAVALPNSLKFTIVTAPLVVLIGTAIALFLQRQFFGVAIIRSVILLPWVLPGAISAVLWIWVFHPSFGIINSTLRRFGLIEGSIPWLSDPNLAFVAIATAHVWTQIPFAVVLTMAALYAINDEVLEAGKIDVPGSAKRFFLVTFPQIKAMIVVLLIYNSLVAFTSYDLVYAMTGGGPGTATSLVAFQIWRESFSMYDFGAGAAVAFIVVMISALMIIAITRALPSDLFGDS